MDWEYVCMIFSLHIIDTLRMCIILYYTLKIKMQDSLIGENKKQMGERIQKSRKRKFDYSAFGQNESLFPLNWTLVYVYNI